jgi:hypothetical protein
MHAAMRTLRPTAGLAAVFGVAAGLGLFCWLILTPPDGSCAERVPQATIDAYRNAVVPAHLLALLALLALGAVVALMSRLKTGHVSRPTAVALAATGLVAVAAYADHRVFAVLAIPGVLILAVLGPLLAVFAAVALALRFRRRPTPVFTSAAAWAAIALLPGHLGLVLVNAEPFFCF